MRISSAMFGNNYIPQLNQLQSSQNQLENEASTGLSVSLPEDDPTAMAQALGLQSAAAANTQYQKNITQLQSDAANASTPINQIQNLVSQASQLALNAGGANGNSTDLQADANTVEGYLSNILTLANSTDSNGNYIFGGSNTSSPPFVATYDSNNNITAITYQGNTDVSSGQIAPNVSVTASVVGANTTGSGPQGLLIDSASGVNVFNDLISFQQQFATGKAANLSSSNATNLEADDNHLINQISANSVVQSTLESANTNNTDVAANLSSQLTTDTSANLSDTLTKLSQTQTAYQAALESGVLVMNLSITQYLS